MTVGELIELLRQFSLENEIIISEKGTKRPMYPEDVESEYDAKEETTTVIIKGD